MVVLLCAVCVYFMQLFNNPCHLYVMTCLLPGTPQKLPLKMGLVKQLNQMLVNCKRVKRKFVSSAYTLQELPRAVCDALVSPLQKTIPALFENIFKKVVLPSFEKSCQDMFRQVDEAFRKGTAECKNYSSLFKTLFECMCDRCVTVATSSV